MTIQERIDEVAKESWSSEEANIRLMVKIGHIVLDHAKERAKAGGKKSPQHSYGIISDMLREANCKHTGRQYVMCSCRLVLYHGHELDRIIKLDIPPADIMALTTVGKAHRERILQKIEKGELEKKWNHLGQLSYQIGLNEVESRKKGKREKHYNYTPKKDKPSTDHLGQSCNPDVLSKRVVRHGVLDEDALVDLMRTILSRFPNKAQGCWDTACRMQGVKAVA